MYSRWRHPLKTVSARSWCQTATDGAWYSTTALLSGCDRPLSICVLRHRGSEPKTRRTGAWRPLKHQPPRGARWNAELYRYPQPIDAGGRNAPMPDLDLHSSRSLRRAWPEVCRWITYLAGRSSSWELRAGRTGPTVMVLPWLQTALKSV